MAEKKTFSIRIEKELMKALRLLAIKKEIPFGVLMEEAAKDLLKKYGEKIK